MSYNPTEDWANNLFDNMLKLAYAYYILDESNESDAVYDSITKTVYRNRDIITRPYKSIIDWGSLENCSSLFYLTKDQYPVEIIKCI